MNFNLLLILLLISACGLKGNPIPPKGTKLPSILEKYPDIKTKEELNETQNPS